MIHWTLAAAIYFWAGYCVMLPIMNDPSMHTTHPRWARLAAAIAVFTLWAVLCPVMFQSKTQATPKGKK